MTGKNGENTLDPFSDTPYTPPTSVQIPIQARRALHRLGPIGLEGQTIVIDLIEMPEMQHIGIRVYLDQIAPLNHTDKMKVIERMYLMQSILRSNGVSSSLEKVIGSPPKR
jgi:hypothetical protein